MFCKTIILMLISLVSVMGQCENTTTLNIDDSVCGSASNILITARRSCKANECEVSLIRKDLNKEKQREQETSIIIRHIKKMWIFICSIIFVLAIVFDWFSNHIVGRFIMWVIKFIAQIIGLQKIKTECQHVFNHKVGSQEIGIRDIKCGDNSVVNIGTIQGMIQQNKCNDKSNATEKNVDRYSCVLSEDRLSAQKSKWPEIERTFKPYEKRKIRTTLKQLVEDELRSVDEIRANCPKKNIPICVIDDKDDEKYREGLKTLGYENVTTYSKCPAYDDLKLFAIVIFDVRGIGNAAGNDGFSLAVNFKLEHPLKVVGVRSAYLQGVSDDDKVKVDFAIEKNRDLCKQVPSILNDALNEVGNPIIMWKKVRKILIEGFSIKEVALIEHEYVHAIQALSQETEVLPTDWMDGVNRLLKRKIF